MLSKCIYVRVKKLAFNKDRIEKCIVLVPFKLLGGVNRPFKGKLKFGLSTVAVTFIPRPITDIVAVSADVMEELNMPVNCELCAKFEKFTLSLGPVIGFITNGTTKRRILSGNPNEKIMRAVHAARSAHTFLYFFTINDILWDEDSIKAVLYNHVTDTWEERMLPMPDVIYDRGQAGGLSRQGWHQALSIRSQLASLRGLKKINAQHYFDKWDVHYRLSKHEDMKKYLPDTILYKDTVDDLEYMIDKYSTVYIKACIGSNGRSVIRVKKVGPSKYEYDHFRGKLVKDTVNSLEDIPGVVQDFLGGREYLIQQGINAFTYQGNKVDIRVLIQKDSSGRWQITSMPVRIASNNSPVTSTKSGSTVYMFEDAFLNVLGFKPDQVKSLKYKIYRLIHTAVDTIEMEYGSFGELGIDVAIDNNLDVWFIETNSKPAKDTIIKSGSEEDIQASFMPPFQYARYIAGFN